MITIKEVAKKARVSVGTVDRVLHDRGRVSSDTAKRVRQILKSANYQPNLLARSLANYKIFQFGVLMPSLSTYHHYWEMAIRGIEKARHELKIHKIEVTYYYYDGYSEDSFLRTSEKVLQKNLDGLVMVPTMYTASATDFVKKIPRHVPYVFFNSCIPDTSFVAYIGQDSQQSGMLAGDIMLMLVQRPGVLVVLTPLQDEHHISRRRYGFIQYVKQHSTYPVKVYGAQSSEDRETFQRMLDQVFNENSDVRGIYVTTASTHYVGEYLEHHPEISAVQVVGHDLTDENVKFLKSGLIHFLIGQRPEEQGYQAIYSLYRHVVVREKVAANIMMPLDVVTRMNVDYFRQAESNGMVAT